MWRLLTQVEKHGDKHNEGKPCVESREEVHNGYHHVSTGWQDLKNNVTENTESKTLSQE